MKAQAKASKYFPNHERITRHPETTLVYDWRYAVGTLESCGASNSDKCGLQLSIGATGRSRFGDRPGTPDVGTRELTTFCLPFFRPASRSCCWMRRVSSFCRSGLTQVYSPVISRSLWPAIFDASIALPPICWRHVMLARRNECRPSPGKSREEVAGPVARVEKGFDLAAQVGIATTCLVEQRGAVFRGNAGEVVEELFDSPPHVPPMDRGKYRIRPLRQSAHILKNSLLREFGLTPSSRTRIAVVQEPEIHDVFTELATESRRFASPN
jgi:hypothetical protein